MTNKTKPLTLTKAHRVFLENLRQSGVTNMWGAAPYLEAEFDLSREEAKRILLAWFKTFEM